jgi:flagellar biosynthesis/type III secretory pathway protein FliH
MTRILRASSRERTPPRRPNPERTRVLNASTLQCRLEAEEMLHRAREEARSIVESANLAADETKRCAEEQSRAHAAALIATAERHARLRLEENAGNLTRLAVRIAEKILGQQLKLEPGVVTEIVKECLRSARTNRRAILRVHPEDLVYLDALFAHLKALCATEDLLLQADATVERGGCILETELGQMDGQIKTQLQLIEEELAR